VRRPLVKKTHQPVSKHDFSNKSDSMEVTIFPYDGRKCTDSPVTTAYPGIFALHWKLEA